VVLQCPHACREGGCCARPADVPYHVMLRSGTTFIDVASGGLMEAEADLRRLIATATAPPNAAGASAVASDAAKGATSPAEEAPVWHNFNMTARGTAPALIILAGRAARR